MEMGRRDVRRGGTNRFSKKQSGSGFSTKSKKGMLKKLGLTDGKLNSSKKQEMDYEFSSSHSDLEKEVSKKKTRIPKKNMKDTNGVDHASVPRKLRSAMKKRNLESISKLSSASSKRLNRSKTGIESFNKENQQVEAKAIVSESSMMISKDEKEVAETLYGLAGMFTESEKTCDPLSDEIETSRVDDSSLVVEAESLEPAVSALSSDKTKLIDEIPPLEQSKGVVDFIDRLKQNSSVNTTDSPVRVIETKVATSDTDYKTNGLALWPGLSSTVQSGAHLVSKPSSTKLPPWMGQAVYPSKNISEPLRIQPRKLKKCASHIYISRLIKQLQSSSHQNEQRSSEMSERVLPDRVTTISNFKTMVSPSKRYQNPFMLDLHRTHHPKPVQEDMTQLALDLYHPHTSQKQSYDFLSLSSAGASQSHFPLVNSLPQYHHISAAYNSSQLSPSTSTHQVSPYLASRFQTAYNANQQQQQQLQKRLWAAQYRPQTSGYMNQYIKPNLSLNLTSTSQSSIQPLHVASSPRYNNNNGSHSQQQHHRLMAAAISMSHHHHHHNNNLNRQEHSLLPLIYEDTRTPLQLLCNEQS